MLNEETIRELAQLTIQARRANRQNLYSAEQVFNMLCLRFVYGIPLDDLKDLYKKPGEDETIVYRITLPENEPDARYVEVRRLFFKLYNRSTIVSNLQLDRQEF
jgi:hypothetical protein